MDFRMIFFYKKGETSNEENQGGIVSGGMRAFAFIQRICR